MTHASRSRLSTALTALLYLGPLLSGGLGHPAAVVPLFAAIFILWAVAMQPASWPRGRAGWLHADRLGGLAGTVFAQAFLVVACFAVGCGIGAFLPATPDLPVTGPLVLSLAALVLARLAVDPHGLAMIVDHRPASPTQAAGTFDHRRADRLVAPFFDLPDSTCDLALLERLTDLAPHLTCAALLDALARRIEAEVRPCHAARRALILQATAPATADTCIGRREPVRALRIAGQDRALLRLLALRLGRLQTERPLLRTDCPSVDDLRAAFPGRAIPQMMRRAA